MTRAADDAHGSESGVVDGFYTRPVAGRQDVPVVQRDRRLQSGSAEY